MSVDHELEIDIRPLRWKKTTKHVRCFQISSPAHSSDPLLGQRSAFPAKFPDKEEQPSSSGDISGEEVDGVTFGRCVPRGLTCAALVLSGLTAV